MSGPRKAPPDDATLVHALKLHQCPGVPTREVEARFGLSARVLRAARARLADAARWTDEDRVLSGMRGGAWTEPAGLVGWIDYADHARWTEAEVEAVLARLELQGRVERDGARWRLRGAWP